MDAFELYSEETEGWPYDGSQTTFSFEGRDFILVRTRRHIDADDERSEVERMGPEAGLRWLREHEFEAARIAVVLIELLPELELVASLAEADADDDDGPLDELRRVGGVWLHRERGPSSTPSTEDPNAGLGRIGRVIESIGDRLEAWRLGIELDALDDAGGRVRGRETWRWLEPAEVRERLAGAGWSPEQIAAVVR